jgi:hypothetical protein
VTTAKTRSRIGKRVSNSVSATRSYSPSGRGRPLRIADAQRPRHLGLLERDAHTIGGQVESQAASLGVQLDDHAIFVLEIGDRTAG